MGTFLTLRFIRRSCSTFFTSGLIMLKNLNKNLHSFQSFVAVRNAHYKRKRDLSDRNKTRLKYVPNSPYNRGYNPTSRNVYKSVEQEDNDQFDLEGLDDEVWKGDNHYKDHKSEEEKHREFVKHKILERKEKARLGIREPNILTWAARTQIRSLHEEDPYQWTPEVLADSFPVSKQTILKILRSRWLPEDEEAIKRYDRDAHQNWLKLKADLEDSKMLDTSKENKMLVDEKISKLINAAGVPSFPLPHMEDVALTRKKLVEKLHPQATGQFSSIISNYKAQFKITEVKSIGSVDKPENVGVAIGDKDSVQLLSQITALNEKRAKQKDNSDISDRMEDKDRVTEATEKSNLHKNKLSETKGRDFDVNRSRRQRRLGEVEVSSDNLEHLQMLGTQKIS